jgi:hypothetical protein
MADRHYGLDVKVMAVGSTDVKAVFESFDLKDTSLKKTTQSAQDTVTNNRAVGSEWTASLSKFVEGDSDWLFEYCRTNRNNINLQCVMTVPGTGNDGTTWKTITITGAIVDDLGLNISGEGTKESYTFSSGAGGDYAVS